MAQLYNPDKKSEIKIGKVVCTNNSKVCQDQEIGDELLTLRYYAQEGKRFDYEAMANFFTSTIAVHVKNFLLEEATALKIRSGNNFVKFTVPYCGHCKKMAPTWIELENEFKDDPEVSILSVDCKKHKDICNNFNVSGYPSLIWIEDGKRIDKYPGRRSLPDFKKYIDKMHKTPLTAAPNVEPTARESAVLDLTTRDFEKAISSDFSFVYFFLPFCSHCAEIQAVWNELAKKFTSSTNVKIARVNCQSNQEICFREVKGCPTLNIYSEGEKALSDYYEDMSLDGLVDAISSHAKGGEGKIKSETLILDLDIDLSIFLFRLA